MGAYLDLQDVASGHPVAEHELDLLNIKLMVLRHHVERLRQFIHNGVRFGYITTPEKGDAARDTIDRINSRTFDKEELRNAVNENCSCGGRGPGEGECPACAVWHQLVTNRDKRS